MINFGIDLGTTNSAIARFDKGKVEIFKNPVGHKESLPSVVAFKNGRIIVGDKARELLLKDPGNVVGGFKRKMGTTETYEIESLKTAKSPVDLSALVLKELKNFVHTREKVGAAVVTIPASFDTIQSNATKKAGELAGFEQVILLQEPIAASLAYANKEDDDEIFKEGQWLVYDLGGGTFDVALVQIREGEMKVLDHEGDNFLGGNDFDKMIVEQLIVPFLQREGKFPRLLSEMKSARGKYNKLYHRLILLAEDAKMQLTHQDDAEIEFEILDEAGDEVDVVFTVYRNQFESLIEKQIDRTIAMSQAILDRNSIAAKELSYALMVGGSTYIPYVRSRVGEKLGIPINTNIDPTTAVAVGAAFYAGTQRRKRDESEDSSDKVMDLRVKTAFQKASQEEEEYFTAKFEGPWQTLTYRIRRQDGGYDSGQKPLQAQISEYLPLLKDSFNFFELKIYDVLGNEVTTDIGEIGITHGRYSVAGQPLPNDICLEVDDFEMGSTALELVFPKNAILPLRKTLTKHVTRTIARGSEDRLTIHVLEGPVSALPAANQPIGFISISGDALKRDLLKGSDIEIELEISESRDLKITAYLMMTDQEFENVFTPSERHVSVHRLREELELLVHNLGKEVEAAQEVENYEGARELLNIEQNLLELIDQVKAMSHDDVTDDKFQIEDQKRKIAIQIDGLTKEKYIAKIKMEYFDSKREIEYTLQHYQPTDAEIDEFQKLMTQEKEFLATNSRLRIKEIIDFFSDLGWRIRTRDPQYLRMIFAYLASRSSEFKDEEKGEMLIDQGYEAIEDEDWDRLKLHINQLSGLLPSGLKKDIFKGGTGIG
jgi:molecular chaperone DnaK